MMMMMTMTMVMTMMVMMVMLFMKMVINDSKYIDNPLLINGHKSDLR